jgi:hypothetical protein
MKTQPLLILLAAANLSIPFYQFVQPRTVRAATPDVPGVLRGRALEIVDDRGKVRASLSVLPEDPKVIWKGKPYPETVLLRLMNADGGAGVKLGASKTGAGLVIGGELSHTYVQVLARGGQTYVKLLSNDGRERVINP